jgi:hypothetical protein
MTLSGRLFTRNILFYTAIFISTIDKALFSLHEEQKTDR